MVFRKDLELAANMAARMQFLTAKKSARTPSVIAEEKRKFLSRLEDEDPLSFVLRGHLFIEGRLTDMIDAALSRPAALKIGDTNFALKIALAVAMGLIDEPTRQALKHLNKLRNRFAHDLEYELTAADSKSMFNALNAKKTYPEAETFSPDDLCRAVIALLFGRISGYVVGYQDGYLAAALQDHPSIASPPIIPPPPWIIETSERDMTIGPEDPHQPGHVGESVFMMEYVEDMNINRKLMAWAKYIVEAVNNYYQPIGE